VSIQFHCHSRYLYVIELILGGHPCSQLRASLLTSEGGRWPGLLAGLNHSQPVRSHTGAVFQWKNRWI